jgi:4-aminobutyrate aminotransferase
LIHLTCGASGNVVRFLAPTTIPDNVSAEGLGIVEQSIEAAKKG